MPVLTLENDAPPPPPHPHHHHRHHHHHHSLSVMTILMTSVLPRLRVRTRRLHHSSCWWAEAPAVATAVAVVVVVVVAVAVAVVVRATIQTARRKKGVGMKLWSFDKSQASHQDPQVAQYPSRYNNCLLHCYFTHCYFAHMMTHKSPSTPQGTTTVDYQTPLALLLRSYDAPHIPLDLSRYSNC
jgi:hypothetical protein